MSVKPIPEGYTSLTPFLCIDGARPRSTSTFRCSAPSWSTGWTAQTARWRTPNWTSATVACNWATPLRPIRSPRPTRSAPATHSIAFYCEDVDAVVAKAEQAGATIREPAQTFVTGDRFASILDPFGQRWTVMTRVEDVSPEERDRRMAEWAKENVGS